PTQSLNIQQSAAPGDRIRSSRAGWRGVRRVTMFDLGANTVEQVLAVFAPLLHLSRELIKEARVAGDESNIEQACSGGPRAACFSVGFNERTDERFDADGLFPERVAHSLGDGLSRKVARVEEQQLSLGVRRQLATTIGTECGDRYPSGQSGGEIANERVDV